VECGLDCGGKILVIFFFRSFVIRERADLPKSSEGEDREEGSVEWEEYG
jgi:hypothetical protein